MMFTNIGEDNLKPLDYLAGVASFLVIALGGVLIGLIFSIIVSLATRFLYTHIHNLLKLHCTRNSFFQKVNFFYFWKMIF